MTSPSDNHPDGQAPPAVSDPTGSARMLGSAVSIADLAAEIGENIAAPVADEVDRDSRFPREAVDAFRERGLLSALVPRGRGGSGPWMSDIPGAVGALARHCSASALVLAMHSIE